MYVSAYFCNTEFVNLLFQAIVGNYDKNQDARLDYDEFLSYMMDREKKWKINFEVLDKNKCGEFLFNTTAILN